MMKGQSLSLYFNFHKSTLIVNWAISLAVSLVTFSVFSFAVTSFTAGFLMALFYIELVKKNEYFFYYNLGISKRGLIVSNFLFNLVFAVLLIIITVLWKIV
ncbi:hypothetical protein SAMN04487893_10578 [Myroides guanonis]|uniref:Uncharacterized protein n=1 Tax=Myroides guanonis TaxID=1150112 RepID=A0A1I3Q6T1_9FLAO|nr:hypothetical protein SAMN04487893_10578 [Myroides guanonis]